MKEQLIELETAKLAIKVGADRDLSILSFSDEGDRLVVHCTQSLLAKWLREEHDLHIQPYYRDDRYTWDCEIFNMADSEFEEYDETLEFNTYEQTLEYGLIESLKLIDYEN